MTVLQTATVNLHFGETTIMRQGEWGKEDTVFVIYGIRFSRRSPEEKNINSLGRPHLTHHTHLVLPLILRRSAGPDQWLCHPLMV